MAETLRTVAEKAEWHPRPDYGEGVMVAYHGVAYSPVTDAVDWSCRSCRDEVGWPDWSRLQKNADGSIFASVECGHCGDVTLYDLDGNILD